MNPTAQDPAQAKAQLAPAALHLARVVERTDGGLLLDLDGVTLVAARAVSCPVAPLAGDEVLVCVGHDVCHVLAVMRRAEPVAAPAAATAETSAAWRAPVVDGGQLPYQPHFDSSGESDDKGDGEAVIRPYTRFDVPLKPDAFGSGTYFRMGAYVEKEESMMMPALELTKSVRTITDKVEPTPTGSDVQRGIDAVSAAETVNKAEEKDATKPDGSTKHGYIKGGTLLKPTFVKNKSSQMELKTIKVEAEVVTSSGDGFLGKSDSDFNLDIGGGALIDIVKGQTTRVKKGDINFKAPAGAFTVDANLGVSIIAGTPDSPANIALLAYGYVKNEAKGPLSEWYYSTSEKKTYGYSKDWFYGEKYSEFHGTSTSLFYGAEDKKFYGAASSIFIGAQSTINVATRVNMTMAATVTLALGTEFRLNAALDLKINLAIDISIIVGFGVKIVFPMDTKIVIGRDYKLVTGIDHKNVGVDSKIFLTEIKNTTLKAHNADLALKNESLALDKQVQIRNGLWFTT